MASVLQQLRINGPHRKVVHSLARELELPVERVETVYLTEVAKLEAGARVKTFISVLAIGNARAQLRRET